MVGENDKGSKAPMPAVAFDPNRKPGDRPEEFSPSGAPGDDPLTRNLKKVYAQVAAEPVPDRLLRLLDQLDAKSKKDGQNG